MERLTMLFKDLDPVKLVYLAVISVLLIISITLFSYNNSLSNRISVVEETQGYLLNEVDVLSHYNTESEHEIMIGLITEMLERLNAKQEESK